MCTERPQDIAIRNGASREFSMNIRYVGRSRIEMRGASTGWIYRFSAAEPVLPVDLRDATLILACNLFTID